jgi:hypothetical protein
MNFLSFRESLEGLMLSGKSTNHMHKYQDEEAAAAAAAARQSSTIS